MLAGGEAALPPPPPLLQQQPRSGADSLPELSPSIHLPPASEATLSKHALLPLASLGGLRAAAAQQQQQQRDAAATALQQQQQRPLYPDLAALMELEVPQPASQPSPYDGLALQLGPQEVGVTGVAPPTAAPPPGASCCDPSTAVVPAPSGGVTEPRKRQSMRDVHISVALMDEFMRCAATRRPCVAGEAPHARSAPGFEDACTARRHSGCLAPPTPTHTHQHPLPSHTPQVCVVSHAPRHRVVRHPGGHAGRRRRGVCGDHAHRAQAGGHQRHGAGAGGGGDLRGAGHAWALPAGLDPHAPHADLLPLFCGRAHALRVPGARRARAGRALPASSLRMRAHAWMRRPLTPPPRPTPPPPPHLAYAHRRCSTRRWRL